MTCDTSTADKRGVEYMYIDYSTWLSRPILVGDRPKPHEVEYVRHDELKAMRARAEKAEVNEGELRRQLGNMTAVAQERHAERDLLRADNERLRGKFETLDAGLEFIAASGGEEAHMADQLLAPLRATA